MNMTKKLVGTLMAIIALVTRTESVKAQGALQPVDLRCGMRVNPPGLGDTAPRLSWRLQSVSQGTAYRGETQSAYEIQVGSAAGAADLWDSGKVASSQTVDIVYGGQALTSGEQCFWQVRVYDGSNNVSAWSAPAQWSMGLLNSWDWTAQWIGYDAAYTLTPQQASNNALFNTANLNWICFPNAQAQAGIEQSLLRKQVVLPAGQTITNAVMALYADNFCNVYVNGLEMTNTAMRWEATARINVTAWLHAGTNLLALGATNSDVQDAANVIGQMVVQFASGGVSNIPVDATWKAAQVAPTNWMETNFDDSAWTTAESNPTTPWGTPALNDVARVPAPYLRKTFVVPQTVTNATVYVTALGAYELRLNGQKVGNDVLTPGWTQFTKRVYYQTYDVTGMVQAGSNTLSAILGDGWYASVLAYKGQRCNYGGTPRLMAQLVLSYSSGGTQTIDTDSSWKASYGPIQYGDLLIGSGYDARLEMPGWDTTNFNDSAWAPVATGLSAAAVGYSNVTAIVTALETNNQLNFVANNATMGGDPAYGIVKTLQVTFTLGGTNQTESFAENSTVKIGGTGQTLTVIQALYGNYAAFPGVGGLQVQAAVTEPSRCLATLAAINLTEPKPGCYTFDLGQNMVGWVQLTISGNIGDRITVRHGEMLNPDGSIYTANLRGATATDFYIFGTNGTVVYEPRFTFHGFRYVEVRGLSTPPTLNSVTGIVVHSDIAQTGAFVCSSPLVNQLYSNIIWGQRGNYLEVPTDCPQRDERMGWTGDTEFFVPTAAYNFDVQSFFRRHLVTLCEDSQEADGAYADVAPDMGVGSGAAAWGDAGWICPYNMYRSYGDTNVIGDHYASFQLYGQFLAGYASNYVVAGLPGDFGDWVNLGGGAFDTVIDTAYYAYYAQAMSEMAAAIGKSADAATYTALHSNIVAAFASFFNSSGSFTDGSSQTGYALAFTLDLVPAGLYAQVAQQFANSIAQFDNHLATGFVGTPRLLPALHAVGRDDLAYDLLLQQTYPSWLYQVILGSTTMWERWDGWTPSAGFESDTMNSFNHYAFGSVGQYLYSVVGGINPASPGYKSILIQPVTGSGLTWADTSYNSTRGLISTAWTNVGGAFNLSVVIPPNTTAQVYVPTTNPSAITESGVPATNSPGVTYVGMSNGYAIYAVGSGNYVWSSPVRAPVGVMETDSVYAGGSFPALPAGDLLANKTTTMVTSTITAGPENHLLISALYDGNIGEPLTTNRSYEISGGAITFYLGPGANGAGYTITNLNTYTAWQDDGREDANYAVSYSTDGANFFPIATVDYNPSPYPTKDGTGGTLTSVAVANLTGVRYLKWDFTAAQQNGDVGYTELAAFGQASVSSVPATLSVTELTLESFVMNVGGLASGQNYMVQSSTNLAGGVWSAETNFVAVQGIVAFTNSIANSPQKFYRIVAY
ncbi:MAG: glycoside hydrolase family 78 protein [Verrucomicrobiota bacterium]|jgi:alpha-L-rhamnosidase